MSLSPTALFLLVVAMATEHALAYPSAVDSAGYYGGGEILFARKRQLEPPVKPEHFKSIEEFKLYMKELEAYLKLLGRQRFGKRTGSRQFGEQRRILNALISVDRKLGRLIGLVRVGGV
ncbi:hypothetical protein BOX15_Mlig023721g1 [Macrostomum lignano]|uniref:Uncharacterized protein n=2 Tax=Macrostomum lignano TaxID=282301 RepID=A0A267EYD5_9PLAT|nr:hypothetical protein BOX15_Mlig023721g1 [Macrostomum lignano]